MLNGLTIKAELRKINSKGDKMNKTELVEAIANAASITKTKAASVLEAFMDTVTGALKGGDQIVIPGFGSFSTSKREARKGRNPQTGKEIMIPAAKVVKFKAGKKIKEAVQ